MSSKLGARARNRRHLRRKREKEVWKCVPLNPQYNSQSNVLMEFEMIQLYSLCYNMGRPNHL